MMSLISLNIKGVRGNIKRKYVRELIRKEEVRMVCLQETKCSVRTIAFICEVQMKLIEWRMVQ